MNNRSNSNFSLRRLLLTALVAGPLATLPAPLWALPSVASTNLTTSSGVSVTQVSTSAINVTAPDKAVLSWTRFADATQTFVNGESLTFFQPASSSSVLNVVNGGFYTNGGTVDAAYASNIGGTISANGNVYFLNPNGLTIGSTAQINVGGFYASTVGETLPGANFGINGTLTFSGATTATPSLTVNNGANVQAVGSGLNIRLYGRGVTVNGGNFYGNLLVNSNGQNASFGNVGAVTVGSVAGAGGKLTVTTGGGDAVLTGGGVLLASATGANVASSASATQAGTATVTVTGVGSPTTAAPIVAYVAKDIANANAGKVTGLQLSSIAGAGGAGYTASQVGVAATFTVTDAAGVSVSFPGTVTTDAGGAITAITTTLPTYNSPSSTSSGTNSLTAVGGLSVDTTGTTNGKIYQGASALVASGAASTLNAGTGTSAGNISLGAATFGQLTVNGNNVTVVAPVTVPDAAKSDITLNASSIAGNLSLINNAGQIVAGTGATTVGGSIALSQSGNSLSFTGSGNLTFNTLQATSSIGITTSGDIVTPYTFSSAPSFSLLTPTVAVTPAPAGGTNAAFTVTMNANGTIASINTTNAGAGYTAAPVITLTAAQTGASGYATIPVTTTITGGAVTAVNTPTSLVFNGIASTTVNGTVGATAPVLTPVFNAAGQISSFSISGGLGYTAAPTVTVSAAPAGGVTATATATIDANGQITGFTMTNGGSGYTAAPTVTLSGATPLIAPFTINATQAGGVVSITAPAAATLGSGYTAAPTITVTGASGVTQTFATTVNAAGVLTNVIVPQATANQSQSAGNSRQINFTSSGGKISSGMLTTGSTISILAAGDISVVGNSSNPGSTFAITSSGGKVSAGFLTPNTSGNVRAVGDITFGYAGGVGGNLNHAGGNAFNVISSGGTISAGSITAATTTGLTLSVAGDITLPTTSASVLSVTSTSGRILQTAGSYISQNGTSTNNKVTLNAASDITVANAAAGSTSGRINDFNQLVLVNGAGPNGITISGTSLTSMTGTNKAIVIANGTNAKGNVSVTSAAAIVLGAPATNTAGQLYNGADSLTFGGNLTLTANGTAAVTNVNNPVQTFAGTINTFANTVYTFGAVSLNTASNNNAVLGTPGLGNLANYNFGAINAAVGTGTVTVNENQTLNLGNITATTLNATSIAGSIVNTAGAVTATNVVLSAGSIFSPGNITLSNTGNVITQINLINANNVDITTSAATKTTITAGSATQNGKAVLGSLVATELNGKDLQIDTAGAGSFNNVGFNATGIVTINAPGNVTIQNATNTGSTAAVNVNSPGVISLGSGINLLGSGTTTFKATTGSGRIVDASANVLIAGPVVFQSDNDIAITKSGHSFGPVSLYSANAGGTPTSADITYTEGGTANLNVVKVNAGGGTVDGSLKVVSTGGSIIQTNTGTAATSGYVSVPSINGANTVTLQAAGAVTLANPNNTGAALGNNITVPIALTASTDSSIIQGSGTIASGVKLGNVVVSAGGLTVDTSGSAAATATITQASGSTIFSYGVTGFKSGVTAGNNAITVANDGNNFGALSFATGGGNVSVKELGTINLASVITGAGKLTANAGGGIIQTSNVATFGGTAAVAGLNVGGASALTAGASGITLNSSNTAVGNGGITLTTAGNVNISDAAATTTLGTGSTVGGTLTIRNTNAGPNAAITDGGAGNLTVGGNVLFDLVNGNVSISGPNNSFGAIGFRANTVAISENTTLALNGGSVAGGQVTLSSNGDIITSGVGPLTFSGAATSLTLSAGGNITISNAATFVANGLTFLAKGAVDLSALSLIGNLNGKAPNALGSSSYKAPGN